MLNWQRARNNQTYIPTESSDVVVVNLLNKQYQTQPAEGSRNKT